MSYRKNRDAKWEYEIRATNLLNIDSRISNGSSTVSVFASETFMQPRFVTFRIRYTLLFNKNDFNQLIFFDKKYYLLNLNRKPTFAYRQNIN